MSYLDSVMGSDPEKRQDNTSGTTLVAFIRIGEKNYLVHIGDSRVYRVRRGETHAQLLTTAHPFEVPLHPTIPLDPPTARMLGHPDLKRRGLLLGKADIWEMPPLQTGESYVLASDGIGILTAEEIAASQNLMEQARPRAKDNVTIIMVRKKN